MDQPLERYYSKRDFGITPEPKGKQGRAGKRLSYVIQKHAARRLHYDFRLELDGVLKSWAVPKGPSLDPADKRMAVHVEDHPLDYGGFEGTIPAGQYGAGTVIVWDRGEWTPLDDPHEGYRKGKLKFELHGEKLSGIWNLVRMKRRGSERQESWLLIKEKDEAARPAASYSIVDEQPDSVLGGVGKPAKAKPTTSKKAPRKADKPQGTGSASKGSKQRSRAAASKAPTIELPATAKAADLPLMLAPQLATLVADVPQRGDWLYEVKYDGYRILSRFDDGAPRLFTRNGNDWTSRMKPLAAELKQLELNGTWLDGEVVVLGSDGNPDFQALQNSFELGRAEAIQYFIFDVPFYAGHDLRHVPLWQRRDLLRQLLASHSGGNVHFSDDFPVAPGELLSTACEMQLEGVIGKLRDASYESKRSPSWIKLKCSERQEFVIGGWTEPKNAVRGIGALLLGFHEADGTLRYAGKVGTGFTDQSGSALAAKLEAIEVDTPPFDTGKERHRSKVHWAKPKLMAEVSFHEWTAGGHIRHAVFHGIRSDKPPRAIVRERPAPVADLPNDGAKAKPPAKTTGKGGAKGSGKSHARASTSEPMPLARRADLGGVRLTHPERVIDPQSGSTKEMLANYYAEVTDWLLPHLAERPVSLVRAPSGVDSKHFFQKHIGSLKLPGVRELDPALMPGHQPLIAIDSRQGLIGAVQMNVVEFHTWNATASRIDQPNRIVFDLDPGEGVAWQAIVEGTEATRIFLEEIGLRSFLKTSGGKGLHVVVPIQRRYGWDIVKDFSRTVVEHLASAMPERFVAKSGPRNRVGRIFIDYLRNGRGATTAAAFGARARPGLGVSMTVAWEQLFELTGGNQWHIGNAAEWLAQRGDDPWADYDSSSQPLGRAMQKLGFKPSG